MNSTGKVSILYIIYIFFRAGGIKIWEGTCVLELHSNVVSTRFSLPQVLVSLETIFLKLCSMIEESIEALLLNIPSSIVDSSKN